MARGKKAEFIKRLLTLDGKTVQEAAKELGIGKNTLYEYLK